eukprot:TRINITY_DN659_c0_g1_i1.p2 TRINITY_DN659_c0_g1~~TRINITY_DN659_c0_g1_i1.p2  ORF type:complete len:185 (+),score=60.07 TRINITY_DN659_c0_g1_i1:110-664(+)
MSAGGLCVASRRVVRLELRCYGTPTKHSPILANDVKLLVDVTLAVLIAGAVRVVGRTLAVVVQLHFAVRLGVGLGARLVRQLLHKHLLCADHFGRLVGRMEDRQHAAVASLRKVERAVVSGRKRARQMRLVDRQLAVGTSKLYVCAVDHAHFVVKSGSAVDQSLVVFANERQFGTQLCGARVAS